MELRSTRQGYEDTRLNAEAGPFGDTEKADGRGILASQGLASSEQSSELFVHVTS